MKANWLRWLLLLLLGSATFQLSAQQSEVNRKLLADVELHQKECYPWVWIMAEETIRCIKKECYPANGCKYESKHQERGAGEAAAAVCCGRFGAPAEVDRSSR